ncbi:TetR family transcriptional regulator C-terminal domain-containing protein [Sphaerisporangium corydalis]|uniref:TetR family transcriptional regulator C-terminal domain-containing protein n=1 Tax=Sphaerisporangium corydalis TaxID=1441875 RepID=A0ABV9EVH0_9ACTN|nr:hypothetical protein [Sphaerisporangium corydalis]
MSGESSGRGIPGPALRGCPFHNASVEVADLDSRVRVLAAEHKRDFARRLTDVAAQAGAADPEALAEQLAVLFDGATALSTTLNHGGPFAAAASAATILIDAAIPPAEPHAPTRP